MLMSNLAPIRKVAAQDGPAFAGIADQMTNKTSWIPPTITCLELKGILTDRLPKQATYMIGTGDSPKIRLEWRA